jgi:hypothetical protein
VWQQIEAESNGPSTWNLFTAVFQPRLAWAAVSVALIAIFGLGIYFMGTRRNNSPALGVANVEHDGNQPKEPASTGTINKAPSPVVEEEQDPGERQVDKRPQKRRLDRYVAPDRPRLAVNSPDAFSPAAETSSPAVDSKTGGDTLQEKALRMEMQTRDPNIRIIWFSPRDTKPVSPNSKGI